MRPTGGGLGHRGQGKSRELARAVEAYVRRANRRKRPELAGNPPPRPPKELVFALRVSVADLRPWEYAACPSDEYQMILHLRSVYAEAQKRWPPDWDVAQRQATAGLGG